MSFYHHWQAFCHLAIIKILNEQPYLSRWNFWVNNWKKCCNIWKKNTKNTDWYIGIIWFKQNYLLKWRCWVFLFVCLFVCLFRAVPAAYGGSQARGPIGAVATGLHQSHGNSRSPTHWVRPGIKPTTSWFLDGFISAAPQQELPKMFFHI